MKKLSILILALFVGYVAHADNPSTPPKYPPIPIHPESLDPKPRPLSLFSDIEANYSDGILTVTFNTDLGDADIVVTNTTIGESWYDSVNGVGATSIALSGDEGYYEIYIYTDCGDYSGTFII